VLAAAGAGLFFATGPWGAPRFAEVEGTVTLDGQPLPDVHVGFYPDANRRDKPPHALARTDKNGHYRIAPGERGRGVAVGRHRVGVFEEADRGAKGASLGKVPKKYQNLSTTPLRYRVRDGSQTIDLELTSAP
jgi:hypothetical protein